MAFENLCMYCFSELEGSGVCPSCGRDNNAAVPQIQLLPGTLLNGGRFLIGRAMGQDSRGIVYAAFDTRRETKLRIREYLPRDAAERLNDGRVVPLSGSEDAFEQGITKLRASVESVEDPAKRHFFFEENGTCYIAQKKSAAAAAAADEVEEPSFGSGKIALYIGIAAGVVLLAAVIIILLLNNALDKKDTALDNPSPTENAWVIDATPSPTPYVAPTIGDVGPLDLAWQNDSSVSGRLEEFMSSQIQTKTAAPTGFVLTKEQIKIVQGYLQDVGLLTDSKVDGDYGQKTTRDMKIFQEWVNEQLGSDVLPEDGKCDELTYQYLQYSAVNGFKVVDTAPTATIGAVESVEIYVDGEKATSTVKYVSGSTASLSWSATGSVQSYYVTILDQNGNEVAAADNITYTSVAVDTTSMVGGVNYTVKVGAVPVGGTEETAVWASAQFALVSLATPTPVPTETPIALPTVTPVPTDAPATVIDGNSAADAVRPVQEKLITIGLLPDGEADGAYGEKTAAAVRAFQEWFNENYGEAYGMLDVTGVCDEATLARIGQAVDLGIKIPSEADPTATPAATPTPEPEPTEAPVVGPESDPESIKYVQGMLAAVGLMEDGSDSGVYDEDTAYAVTRFQNWFNESYGVTYGELDVTGECDEITLQWLEQCVDQGIMVEQPEQRVIAIDRNSDAQSIAYLQDLLISVGLMTPEEADGTWNDATDAALEAFCEWFNENYGASYGMLEAGGVCDENMLTRLEQAQEKGVQIERPASAEPTEVPAEPTDAPTPLPTEVPTPEPTEAPTPTPEPTEAPTPTPVPTEPVVENTPEVVENTPTPVPDVVTTGSDPELVKLVQTALVNVGLLEEGDVDGDYGNMTREAVLAFQKWFNQNYGASYGMLEETGDCDKSTYSWMEKCVESGIVIVPDPTEPPATPTPEPTETPAAEATPVNYVDASSDAEWIARAQQLLIQVGLLPEGSDDGIWGSKTEGAVLRFQEWFNKNYGASYGEIAVQAAFDEDTIGWLMACIENGITVPVADPTEAPAEPTPVPEEPTPVPEEPTPVPEEPTPVPEDPTPAPEATPVNYVDASSDAEWIARAQQLLIQVGLLPEGSDDGVWGSKTEGAVMRFQEWFNENYGASYGEIAVQAAFDEDTIGWLMACIENGVTVPAEDPTPVPEEPTPVPEEPTPVPEEPTPAPTEAPVVGTVSAPAIGVTSESYTEGGVTYVTGESITFVWPAEGELSHYFVYMEDANGNRNELGNVNADTSSMTVSAASFTKGINYTLYVYAYPVNGTDADAVGSSLTFAIAGAEPEEPDVPEEEEKMPETIVPDSDPVWIFEMQERLHQLGWFDEDEWQVLEQGVFDENTLLCIVEFQIRVNALYGEGTVPVIDPSVEGFDPASVVVDELTLQYLMDEELNIMPEIVE